jgi:RNA polymerase sigma-70 factor (ECF subfamily)
VNAATGDGSPRRVPDAARSDPGAVAKITSTLVHGLQRLGAWSRKAPRQQAHRGLTTAKGQRGYAPEGGDRTLRRDMMSTLGFISPADRVEAGVEHGRFRRRLPDADTEGDRHAIACVVARAQVGDREALAQLYVRFADNVYGYVASIVCDEDDAEDVTQQVFVKLHVILKRYEQREAPFLAWLLAVSRNVALDHVRRRRSIPCGEVVELDGASREPDSLHALAVRDALAELPPAQREIVLLRHVMGLSPGEIAGRMGRTEASVHGLHHRGRRALRTALSHIDAVPAVMAS